MSLSQRQQQLFDILKAWQRSATAAELQREMGRRYGVTSTTYDLLGQLRRKGAVRLVDGEWEIVS